MGAQAEAWGVAAADLRLPVLAEADHEDSDVVASPHHAPGGHGVLQDGLAGLSGVPVQVHQLCHLQARCGSASGLEQLDVKSVLRPWDLAVWCSLSEVGLARRAESAGP